tara:strand:+ start:2098 stop:2526 length:429 start_codon:yes stop_codon:yes gene_type:complete
MIDIKHKIGVIPFRTKGSQTAILFVTSQTRGRWILPKGKLKSDENHEDGCKREAFEEAGVKGEVLTDFPITTLITKSIKGRIEKSPVTYYPFIVHKQLDEWPEKQKRERHWALIEDVSKVVSREDYLSLINQFIALKPWITK